MTGVQTCALPIWEGGAWGVVNAEVGGVGEFGEGGAGANFGVGGEGGGCGCVGEG